MKVHPDRIYAICTPPRSLRLGDKVQHTLTNLRGTVVGYQRYGNVFTRWFNKYITVQLDNGRLVPGLHPKEFVLASSRSGYMVAGGGIVAHRQSI